LHYLDHIVVFVLVSDLVDITGVSLGAEIWRFLVSMMLHGTSSRTHRKDAARSNVNRLICNYVNACGTA